MVLTETFEFELHFPNVKVVWTPASWYFDFISEEVGFLVVDWVSYRFFVSLLFLWVFMLRGVNYLLSVYKLVVFGRVSTLLLKRFWQFLFSGKYTSSLFENWIDFSGFVSETSCSLQLSYILMMGGLSSVWVVAVAKVGFLSLLMKEVGMRAMMLLGKAECTWATSMTCICLSDLKTYFTGGYFLTTFLTILTFWCDLLP